MVAVHEARTLINDGAFLLDVREDEEYANGRSADAVHIRLADVPDRLDDIPRDQLIVCVCRSGGRSGRATEFLLEQGFNAVNLEGGMLAWQEAQLPMIADQGEPFVE
jgi:rhodanese-related sulfurtransferase